MGGFPTRGSQEGWKYVKHRCSGVKKGPKTEKLRNPHIYIHEIYRFLGFGHVKQMKFTEILENLSNFVENAFIEY